MAAQPRRMVPTTLQPLPVHPYRRGAGIGHFAEIVAIAIGAAGADCQGTGGVRSAKRRDQKEGRSENAPGRAQKPDHHVPPPGRHKTLARKGCQSVNAGRLPGRGQNRRASE